MDALGNIILPEIRCEEIFLMVSNTPIFLEQDRLE